MENIVDEVNQYKDTYYDANKKNTFFKEKQKAELIDQISNNFDMHKLMGATTIIIPNTNKVYINYEIFKKGISISKNEEIFQEMYSLIDNSFLKIEYFNYIIDNQLSDLYELIEKNKENKAIQKEYYFHYIYGRYYAKRNDLNLSNFYFCQFFKTTNQSQKIDYYCNNYDKNKISILDNSYALSN